MAMDSSVLVLRDINLWSGLELRSSEGGGGISIIDAQPGNLFVLKRFLKQQFLTTLTADSALTLDVR